MGKSVKIDFVPTGYTHNVYSGLTITGVTTLVCSGVTETCDFEVPSGITEDFIWVKLTCDGCNDQYYKVLMGAPQ